jgi:hydroxyacylglutathione hydrolase
MSATISTDVLIAPDHAGSRSTLVVEQYYLDCLSHASYLIADTATGQAAIVDPQRDVEHYITTAAHRRLTIAWVLETHVHADFLSGHLELSRTGAPIGYSKAASGTIDFSFTALDDGHQIALGSTSDGVVLEIRATPGHTPESMCIVVRAAGATSEPVAVLTGDTLLIGDVGRPDLLSSKGVTAEELARSLFHSVHTKLFDLPADALVLPAHGQGSSCARNLSSEIVSTIAQQRLDNASLQFEREDQFVAAITSDQRPAPSYFSVTADLNRRQRSTATPGELAVVDSARAQQLRSESAVIIDARSPQEFAAGHLRGAVNVGIDGRFAEFVGSTIDQQTRLILVTPPGRAAEANLRLRRIGYDNAIALVDDTSADVSRDSLLYESSNLILPEQLTSYIADRLGVQLVDVRSHNEVELGTIDGAIDIPVTTLVSELHQLRVDQPTIVFCASGYRSSIDRSEPAAIARVLRCGGVSGRLLGLGGATLTVHHRRMQYNTWWCS